MRTLEQVEAKLVELAKAALAYDRAIRACGNDPDKMSSYCTTEGDDLDSLYFVWSTLARDVLMERGLDI